MDRKVGLGQDKESQHNQSAGNQAKRKKFFSHQKVLKDFMFLDHYIVSKLLKSPNVIKDSQNKTNLYAWRSCLN